MNRTRIIGIALALVLALGGAVVLTGYVSTADSRALAGTKLVPAYVAKQTIPAATAGEDVQRYLAVKQIPAVAALPGLVTDLASLKGLKSTATIEQGEQLIAARWSKTAAATSSSTFQMRPDMEAVTVALPVEQAVGGQLKAGDTVGVVIASDKTTLATQKLHNVAVLKVQPGDTMSASTSASGSSSGAATVDKEMVTLAVETDGAAQLVWGQHFGTVWLTLEQATTDHSGDPTATAGACKSNCTPVYGGTAIDAAH
jgi:Flp pilus assembly protein CpaB